MSDDNRNKGFNLSDEELASALPKVKPSYSRTKAEVWEAIEQHIGEEKQRPTLHHTWLRYAVAAVVVLMLGVTGFMRLFTEDYSTISQEMMAVILPDGSHLQLNGASSLSYHPHWWRFQREVKLEGEAFFEVKPGERFQVISEQGITAVFGTSFNVYARGNEYEVTCHTGKVRVSDVKRQASVDILPQQKATIAAGGGIIKEEHIDLRQSLSWTEAMFEFEGAPIAEVFRTIERQYQVQIAYPINLDLHYSGKFSRKLSADQVMNMICRSFVLDCVKKGSTYTVSVP